MRARGFSLLEVMIALAILALSLGVLLSANVSAIASVQRIEGMTAATLLARGKMLDLERQLNKEGFKADEEERDGEFEDEGHAEIKWVAKILPIKVQSDKIMEMAGSFAGLGDDKSKSGSGNPSPVPSPGGAGAADPLGFLGPLIAPVAQSISDNMRLVSLEVSWPEGKYRGKFTVNAIITSRALKQVNQQAQAPGGSGLTGLIPSAPQPLPGTPIK